MRYLSDVNLRAALTVLIRRAGGVIEISNEELYDAMLSEDGGRERFRVAETGAGLRLTVVHPDDDEDAGPG